MEEDIDGAMMDPEAGIVWLRGMTKAKAGLLKKGKMCLHEFMQIPTNIGYSSQATSASSIAQHALTPLDMNNQSIRRSYLTLFL